MPTETEIGWRRSEAAQPAKLTDTTVMLLTLIACLINLVLIAWSPTIAAAVAASGQY